MKEIEMTSTNASKFHNCAKQNIDRRPRQDSNLQSPDPKSGALSIRPRGHIMGIKHKRCNTILRFQSCLK